MSLLLSIGVGLATLLGIIIARSATAVFAVAFLGIVVMILSGVAFSYMMHSLHIGMSGDPEASSLGVNLIIGAGSAVVLAVIAAIRLRHL